MGQDGHHRATVALRSDRVLWRNLDGRVLALDTVRARYLRLNHSGSVLWRALAWPREPDELIDVLVRTYDVAREQASADVVAFLARLRADGLVVDAA